MTSEYSRRAASGREPNVWRLPKRRMQAKVAEVAGKREAGKRRIVSPGWMVH